MQPAHVLRRQSEQIRYPQMARVDEEDRFKQLLQDVMSLVFTQ